MIRPGWDAGLSADLHTDLGADLGAGLGTDLDDRVDVAGPVLSVCVATSTSVYGR